MASALIIFLLLGFVMWTVVRRFGRSQRSGSGLALRRVFQYLVLFGLLIIVALGLSGLLRALMDSQTLIAGSRSDLARSLAFTVVGLPIFVGVAWWTRRRFQDNADEGDSPEWGLYLTAASIVSLGVAITAAIEVLGWAFGINAFEAASLAQLVVWGGSWAFHYWLSTRVTTFERNRAHNVIGSIIGLGFAVGGVVALLSAALESLLFSRGSLLAQNRYLTESLIAVIVGALVWFAYWIRRVRHSERDVLWLAYVLLLGVAGGLAMWVIAASTALYRTAVWFIGDPVDAIASTHFANLPSLIATAAVGLLVWWYHRSVLASGPHLGRTEVTRVYEYLIAAIGLIAGIIGLSLVIIAIFDAVIGSRVVAGGSAINTLLAAVTLLLVGIPVWWIFWRRAQREAAAAPTVEVPSTSRRAYLFILFGVSGITAIISLLVAVYALFDDLVEGTFSQSTIRDMRVAVSILIATGLVAWYHVMIYRQDRHISSTHALRGPQRVLLVGTVDEAMVRSLAHRTGAHIQVLRRLDGQPPLTEVAIIDALAGSTAEEVLVLARPEGVDVIPVQR